MFHLWRGFTPLANSSLQVENRKQAAETKTARRGGKQASETHRAEGRPGGSGGLAERPGGAGRVLAPPRRALAVCGGLARAGNALPSAGSALSLFPFLLSFSSTDLLFRTTAIDYSYYHRTPPLQFRLGGWYPYRA